VRVLLLFLTTLFAACSSLPAAPELGVGKVVTNDRPLPVPCTNASDIPGLAAARPLAADADYKQKQAWVALRIEQWKKYIALLRAALIACSTGGK
jgi:hypothetical protein